MRKRMLISVVIAGLAIVTIGHASGDPPDTKAAAKGQAATQSNTKPAPAPTTYRLVAWSELGMHCMDGKDYSVFSVLPPYNVVHAQLIKMGEPPVPITSGVTITYVAMKDATGSINTISSTKTNFWSYINVLFHNNNPPDVGLTGNHTQNLTPHKLTYDSAHAYWTADGIPTMPYDDQGNRNPYGMARIVARDSNGVVLASAPIVLSVSDEMSCTTCHASNSDPYAKPASGWENNPNPAVDVKLNILRKHDDRWTISQYMGQLQTNGYTYQPKLYDTAISGTPVLCAACHSDNALSLPGISGIKSLTADMHTLHGPQVLIASGNTLDTNSSTSDLNSCYLCHPGPTTLCKRGAMNTQLCSACHGNLSTVGSTTRTGWLDVPSCQMCHNNSLRYKTTFTKQGTWRQTTDMTFATNPNVPVTGKNLYRYSAGHGTVYCSGCHGSPHSEFPTLQPNDNVYSVALQGHRGKIAECSVCHTNVPTTANGGPHNMHNVGQKWVSGHEDLVEQVGVAACAYCHGSNYRGSFLSKTSMARSLNAGEYGQKNYKAGDVVSCYDCHNGPNGG
jgi:hypothetical protein